MGAADRGRAAQGQDSPPGSAAHPVGHRVASHERHEVAERAGRTGALVAGRAAVIRWSKLGVRQRLLDLCQEKGLSLGLVHLDGTIIRAHQKAAGAEKRGSRGRSETSVKLWAALVAATAQRPA